MTCPAVTESPSRTVTSRTLPLVLGATAESSPSIRPLRATMLGGRLGEAKNNFQINNPKITMDAITKMRTVFERGAGGAGAGGSVVRGVFCSSAGGACVRVFAFSSLMMILVPHFLQVREGEFGDVLGDPVQLF